jgi:hypothetical protein
MSFVSEFCKNTLNNVCRPIRMNAVLCLFSKEVHYLLTFQLLTCLREMSYCGRPSGACSQSMQPLFVLFHIPLMSLSLFKASLDVRLSANRQFLHGEKNAYELC